MKVNVTTTNEEFINKCITIIKKNINSTVTMNSFKEFIFNASLFDDKFYIVVFKDNTVTIMDTNLNGYGYITFTHPKIYEDIKDRMFPEDTFIDLQKDNVAKTFNHYSSLIDNLL